MLWCCSTEYPVLMFVASVASDLVVVFFVLCAVPACGDVAAVLQVLDVVDRQLQPLDAVHRCHSIS